ncbi:MAG: hypothetical protein ABH863_03810 [Candidatus Micrarchaeota archaeon]
MGRLFWGAGFNGNPSKCTVGAGGIMAGCGWNVQSAYSNRPYASSGKKKGQAAMEYMVMLGFAIAIILPLWLYVNSSIGNTKAELDMTYAKVAVNKVKDAADSVYVQGAPASIYLDIDMPDNIESTSVSGREIQINLNTAAGISEIYAVSIANLQGSLPTRSGRVRVLVKAESNFVNITE